MKLIKRTSRSIRCPAVQLVQAVPEMLASFSLPPFVLLPCMEVAAQLGMTDGSLRHYSWTAVLRKVAEPFAASASDGATRRSLRGLSSASLRSSGSAPPPRSRRPQQSRRLPTTCDESIRG